MKKIFKRTPPHIKKIRSEGGKIGKNVLGETVVRYKDGASVTYKRDPRTKNS